VVWQDLTGVHANTCDTAVCSRVQDCADDVSLCTTIDGVGTAYCGGTRFTQTFTISHRHSLTEMYGL
jgi:hypothetical protein